MFKINYYRLFLLIALFSNSSNVVCSSFQQSDSHNNLNSVYPHTNPLHFVSHIPIHNNTNCDSLPNGLPSINTSNMQQGGTHPSAMRSLVLNGPNYINVNNNNILFLIPYKWDFSGAGNTLFGANNNTALPSILPNAADTSANMNNIVAPMPPLEKPESTITFSTHTNNNNMPLPMPDELSSSNITSSVPSHTNQDKKPALSEKKKHTKTYICPTCKKVLSHKGALGYHIKTHDPNRQRPFQCHLCNKSFYEKSALKNHLKRHNKGKPFLCDYCPKCFKTKHEKTVHDRTHTGEKPFKCSICGKGFSRKDTLNIHSRTHTGEKPYTCTHCNRCFARRDTLNDHIRTHTGEKLFKCNICQKGLASKASLKNHLNKHTGKKPHKCTQCWKAYATKSGLRVHVKWKHSRLKLTCHYCNAVFSHKGRYENHIRYEESGDEERKCHICKKVYADKYNLARHNQKVHPTNS